MTICKFKGAAHSEKDSAVHSQRKDALINPPSAPQQTDSLRHKLVNTEAEELMETQTVRRRMIIRRLVQFVRQTETYDSKWMMPKQSLMVAQATLANVSYHVIPDQEKLYQQNYRVYWLEQDCV